MKSQIISGFTKATLSLLFIVMLSSCGSDSKQKDSTEVAEEHNDAKFEKAEQKDADFIMQASIINMQEIAMGKLADEKAVSQDAKDLGKMMVEDHQKSLGEVSALAASKGISVPSSLSEDDQKDYKKLSEEKPADFDKKFCDMMIDGHKDAIDKFEKASKDAADPEIKLWALNTLATLRQHLDHSMAAKEKVSK